MPNIDDCNCSSTSPGMLDSRSVWSPRSEGAAHELMIGYPGRLMLAPTASSTLPARHSKSLDQLGPDLVTSHQPPSSSAAPSPTKKNLPRSVSTQLISSNGNGKNHRANRFASPPATVPSRGKLRPSAPSCTSLFAAKGDQSCSAPNSSIGMTITKIHTNSN